MITSSFPVLMSGKKKGKQVIIETILEKTKALATNNARQSQR